MCTILLVSAGGTCIMYVNIYLCFTVNIRVSWTKGFQVNVLGEIGNKMFFMKLSKGKRIKELWQEAKKERVYYLYCLLKSTMTPWMGLRPKNKQMEIK